MRINVEIQKMEPALVTIRNLGAGKPPSVARLDAAALYAVGARASARFFHVLLQQESRARRKAARLDQHGAVVFAASLGEF